MAKRPEPPKPPVPEPRVPVKKPENLAQMVPEPKALQPEPEPIEIKKEEQEFIATLVEVSGKVFIEPTPNARNPAKADQGLVSGLDRSG